MNRKEFILTLLSPILAVFGYKINIQEFFKKPFKFDPVLLSLVRRSMPNLMAYDVCGVQPMSVPSGLIFAMRSEYKGILNHEIYN